MWRDTAGRWPSANQGEKPQKKSSLLTRSSRMSSLQNHPETHFCGLSWPVCGAVTDSSPSRCVQQGKRGPRDTARAAAVTLRQELGLGVTGRQPPEGLKGLQLGEAWDQTHWLPKTSSCVEEGRAGVVTDYIWKTVLWPYSRMLPHHVVWIWLPWTLSRLPQAETFFLLLLGHGGILQSLVTPRDFYQERSDHFSSFECMITPMGIPCQLFHENLAFGHFWWF